MANRDIVLEFRLNGRSCTVETTAERRLLDLLRDDLGRTEVKEGCGEGECGTCSVLVDGQLANACLVPAVQVAGAEVWTVAGAAAHPLMARVVTAFSETGAVQCGFCTPGMVIAATALLQEHPHPEEATIRDALAGNLCRCTGYVKIVDAVVRAASAAAEKPTGGGGRS